MNTARPTARTAKIAAVAAVPAALIASGLIVSQASYSAYSATTTNPTSNWATGTVFLSDDDNNTAAFTASNLKPGATGSKCIVVTSSGSLASAVKLYTTNATTTKSLASHVNLSITQGAGGSFGSCVGYVSTGSVYSGTLADLTSSATNFSTGLGDWAPAGAGSETKTYQISYTLSSSAPDSTQGGTAAVGFTWEAQNS